MRLLGTAVLLALAVVGGALVGRQERHTVDATGIALARDASHSAQPQACAAAATPGPYPGMVWVAGGSFTFGDDAAFVEEGPSTVVEVAGFWIDQTEVTNAQYEQFVAATGHVTVAERAGGSAVFRAPTDGVAAMSPATWWRFMPGADWRHPDGPGSDLEGRGAHPVVHVGYEDALAYAKWQGRTLPTEVQFEFAARGDAHRARGVPAANTWQGSFPATDTAADGFAGIAPVACFPANARGAHDLIGNVWEWTASPYFSRHDAADAQHPRGFDPAQPKEEAVGALKGGSYLCSPDYCMRYRPAARIGQGHGVPSGHIGFRTAVSDAPD